jgi:glutamate racemase
MLKTVFASLMFMTHLFAGTESPVQKALQKEVVTILITDSGLGGLSVAADFERLLQDSKQFKKANIVFCNALPGEVGYNDMKSTEEKAKVFSNALTGMVKWYHPDVIVIACNTLSVVYDQTDFSKTTKIPVVGIVDLAVELMNSKLSADKNSVAILFGTETTIGSNAHKNKLLGKGFSSSRIISQACPKLESEIQTDPSSDMVRTYIDWYVGEAAAAVPSNATTVYAGMVCTHYGYSAEIFLETLKNSGIKTPVIINPNTAMASAVIPKKKKSFLQSDVTVVVVSRAPISEEEIHSIAALLGRVSQPTAIALDNYTHRKDLFEFVH